MNIRKAFGFSSQTLKMIRNNKEFKGLGPPGASKA